MKKIILAAMVLGWMAMAGGAWAGAPVKNAKHLTKAQFQAMAKSRHAQKATTGREIGGSARKGATQVSSLAVKKSK